MASQHFLLDSHERALGVSLVQPSLESGVPPNHTSSVLPVSQHVDPTAIAQVPAAASAPKICQPPAHASSASALSGMVDRPAVSGNVDRPAVSGMVDYGPCRDYWLKYSFESYPFQILPTGKLFFVTVSG